MTRDAMRRNACIASCRVVRRVCDTCDTPSLPKCAACSISRFAVRATKTNMMRPVCTRGCVHVGVYTCVCTRGCVHVGSIEPCASWDFLCGGRKVGSAQQLRAAMMHAIAAPLP